MGSFKSPCPSSSATKTQLNSNERSYFRKISRREPGQRRIAGFALTNNASD